MADPKSPSRDVLAKFLSDHESIKKFERLFEVAGDLTPTDVAILYRLTQEASTDAGIADAKANEALDSLNRIAQSLEFLALASSSKDNSVATDYIDVSTTAPTAVGGVPGRLKWNDTDGTLDLGLKGGNVTLQIGQENVLIVKNDEATPLTDGEVVYVTGASGANLLVKRALANSDVTSASTIGVVTEAIAINGQGYITTFGSVRGLNTNAFNEGDILYLSPTVAGAITNVKPVAPDHMVLVGYCTKKAGGNGEIFVKVDNGYEIDELHNVLITNPVAAGSVLIFDATVGVWKNATLTAGTNVAITNADGSITITVAGAPPTGTAGGVLSGTYPNPGFAVDMATQAELDAHTGNTGNPHATTAAQVGADPVGTAASAVAAHVAAADPHPQYALDSDLAAYALKSGNLSQFAATTSAQLAGVISDETGSGALVFGTSPTMTTPKATSTIGVGNATPSASGAGITFPASASLSSDVNTLDDYEEGTFTPTYTPASGSFTTITVVGAGRYIKIGKTVYFWIDMRTTGASTIGTASGILYITGMPFTCDSSGGYAVASIFQAFNLSTAFTYLGGIVEASQTRVYLTKNSSNSGVAYVQATEISIAAGSFNNLVGLFGRYTTAS